MCRQPLASLFLLFLFGNVSGCALAPEAERAYETIAIDPRHDTDTAITKNRKALEKLRKGHWDQAGELLRESLIADVNYGPAHNNLGWVYYQQQRYYLAAWEFEYAVRLMPDAAEPLNNLGLVFEETGRLPDALLQYEQAAALDPQRAEFLANLARVRIRQGERTVETEQLLREVVLRDEREDWREWASEQLATHSGNLHPASYNKPPQLPPGAERSTPPSKLFPGLQMSPPENAASQDSGETSPKTIPVLPPLMDREEL